MSKGLFDYAAEHPSEEKAPAPAPVLRDVLGDEAEAARLLGEIDAKMKQAAPPQALLFDAFSLIGILANDRPRADAWKGQLAEIYEGLDEPILFTAGDAERLAAKQAEYRRKTIRQLERGADACAKLEKELRAAIKAAIGLPDGDALEWDAEINDDIPQ